MLRLPRCAAIVVVVVVVVCLFIACLSNYLFIYLFVYLFVCLFVCLLACLAVGVGSRSGSVGVGVCRRAMQNERRNKGFDCDSRTSRGCRQ